MGSVSTLSKLRDRWTLVVAGALSLLGALFCLPAIMHGLNPGNERFLVLSEGLFGCGILVVLFDSARIPIERAQTEKALRFEHTLIRGILESSLDGVLVIAGDQSVAAHNKRLLEIWRIDPETIANRSSDGIDGLLYPELLSTVADRVKDAESSLIQARKLYGDQDASDDCEIELKDGRTIERHSTSLRDEDGQHFGRAWFFRDITERKRVQGALRSSEDEFRQLAEKLEALVESRTRELEGKESQLRLLLESTAEAIYGIDMQGNCTFCNPPACGS